MTTAYADHVLFSQRQTGDTPTIPVGFNGVLDSIGLDVSAAFDKEVARMRGIRGPWSFIADTVASARIYAGPPGGVRLLPIDDCVELDSVQILAGPNTVVRTMIANTDYVPFPYSGLPITGVMLRSETWTEQPGSISILAKWGFGTTAPADIVNACIIEMERTYFADRTGQDDRIGMSPVGTIITTKAFAASTLRVLYRYAHGGGFMRGA